MLHLFKSIFYEEQVIHKFSFFAHVTYLFTYFSKLLLKLFLSKLNDLNFESAMCNYILCIEVFCVFQCLFQCFM